MATYLTLIKFTERGAKHVKDTCKRAADFKAGAKKLGIEIREQYWCMGACDGAIIFEAPSDEKATAAMLTLDALDNVTTQTMRAFTSGEMSAIVNAVQ